MQVSAISMQNANCYNMSNNMAHNNCRVNDPIGDTSFNSLTPYYSTKKVVQTGNEQQEFDSICEWQRFCHKQILGGKLNIIA